MTRSTSLLRRLATPLLVVTALLAGCAAMEVDKPTLEKTNEGRAGPQAAPFRTITGFSHALRCMDNMFIDYGVRDVSMLVEEIGDQTKKVNAGTRDMLITSVSDMTRRSRAIRVNAFGKDATNVISFLASAQRQAAYDVVPPYDIKGSVSQFDENVIRNQKDFGIGYSPFINLGIAKDAASSVLGLDLSVLTTDDMSVLSGVTSRNSVVILRSGKGIDGDAAYHKFGVNYSMTFSKSEGQSQALRGLVELASVELMGKLTKTPYWRCLGADPETNEEVKLEVADWYYAMAASRVELIAYFQNQLRQRGFYDGPIDGQFNPAIDEAIANYREALGLSRRPLLDEELFRAYLAADHSKIPPPKEPARYVASAAAAAPAAAAASAAPASAAPASAVAATPPQAAASQPANATATSGEHGALRLQLAAGGKSGKLAAGDAINLVAQTNEDAHVYCYLQDENAKVLRFYPNRFARDSRVAATRPLALPGAMRFALVLNDKGVGETVACFATPRDVIAQLPATVVGTDFEPLPVGSLEQVRNAFVAAAAGKLAQETLHVQAQ
jgi:hypothetical protein